MSDIICVTSRKLCCEDFFTRLEKIAAAKPKAVILREHDLKRDEYIRTALKAADICSSYGVPLIPHSVFLPEENAPGYIHLKMEALRSMNGNTGKFIRIGVSCHSPEEAAEAEALGASYIIAGHIFATDCKRGLPPRGLDYLKAVCNAVSIPVYGIGGISPDNVQSVREQGAAGACVMSGLMKCEDPAAYLRSFERGTEK